MTKHLFDFNAEGRVTFDVIRERQRQNELWGDVDLPNGPVVESDEAMLLIARHVCETDPSFRSVLYEEVLEAFTARTDEERETELIQVAAVAVRWVRQLRRKRGVDRG